MSLKQRYEREKGRPWCVYVPGGVGNYLYADEVNPYIDWLEAEIDRLTAYSRKLLDENIAFANETNRLKARAEKAETEVKFNKSKLRYAADLLLKDKQEYITLAKDHYWDSMENNKDVIIKHIEAIWELWERQED